MSELALTSSLYAQATPAGAYYALSGAKDESSRVLMRQVLVEGHLAPVTGELLQGWTGMDEERALHALHRLERLHFVYGAREATPPAEGSLEDELPKVLKELSETGKAILADDNGLYLASVGFMHEVSEEIAALAGDVLAMTDRHSLLLFNNLKVSSRAWAIADARGRGELSFFPLHVREASFVLIVGGLPRLDDEAFVNLARMLSLRYG